MKKIFSTILVFIFLFSFLMPQEVFAREAKTDYQAYIVKFADKDEITKMHFYSQEEGYQIMNKVSPDRQIEYLEPDYPMFASLETDDPEYSRQWAFPHINVPSAWDETTGDDITIAVLDSGVDLDHPDLEGNLWSNDDEIAGNGIDDDSNGYIDDVLGWDFVDDDNDPNPDLSEYDTYVNTNNYQTWYSGVNHGTVVAGQVAAIGNNTTGIVGVAFDANIMAIRTLNSLGVGSTSSVAQGIDFAVAMGADIVNLSFTGNDTNATLQNSLQNAADKGVLIVAAAGNNDKNLNDTPVYPACSDTGDDNIVLGVASVDDDNQKPSWSNYGDDCIDIAAPGTNIYSTVVYNTEKSLSDYYSSGWYGTSVSAPLVSGVAALVKAKFPTATNSEIMETIIDHAVSLDGNNPDYVGQLGGLIDAHQSLGVQEIVSIAPSLLVAGAGYGGGPQVRIFDRGGNLSSQFFAFAEDFRGGVNVAFGDLDQDDQFEVIAGAGQGGGPQVRVFDQDGNLLSQFFAYDESFRGGVNVALGNVDQDDQNEIITGAGNGGGPQVRVFDTEGNLENQFFAYGENFRGGVYVNTGDLDGDGTDEILTGTGNGGGPQVRTFDSYGNAVFTPGFFAYAEHFRGGVLVSAGDLNGDGLDEIVTGTGVSGGPHVRTFDRFGNAVFTPGFFAYAEHFRGGVLVSVGDLDGDGTEEIITGTGYGGGPHVRTFDRYGNAVFTPGFFAFAENFRGGVNVASSPGITTTTYQYGLD